MKTKDNLLKIMKHLKCLYLLINFFTKKSQMMNKNYNISEIILDQFWNYRKIY